jgi:hypothetical protein
MFEALVPIRILTVSGMGLPLAIPSTSLCSLAGLYRQTYIILTGLSSPVTAVYSHTSCLVTTASDATQ